MYIDNALSFGEVNLATAGGAENWTKILGGTDAEVAAGNVKIPKDLGKGRPLWFYLRVKAINGTVSSGAITISLFTAATAAGVFSGTILFTSTTANASTLVAGQYLIRAPFPVSPQDTLEALGLRASTNTVAGGGSVDVEGWIGDEPDTNVDDWS